MKQTITQAPCLQALFLYFLCFEMVMVHSDWGCLDYTGCQGPSNYFFMSDIGLLLCLLPLRMSDNF